ncbi:MAG TPA: peptidylprolyl isomerase [Anaeromyxobacteraceae bacterium]|nr:peptidylprolyl isomerase [Anaeromyxobacteraceae bacterium]
MKIAKGSVVAVDYRLHLGDGVTVDASETGEPLHYIHGEGQIVPGLERALEGLEIGSTRAVVVSPEDGYGDYDPKGLQEVSHDAFGGRLPEVGGQYLARGPEGETVPFSVKEIRDATVLVDLNHPLAGRTLHFDVTVREVREATPEELEHGHVHGPQGHEH